MSAHPSLRQTPMASCSASPSFFESDGAHLPQPERVNQAGNLSATPMTYEYVCQALLLARSCRHLSAQRTRGAPHWHRCARRTLHEHRRQQSRWPGGRVALNGSRSGPNEKSILTLVLLPRGGTTDYYASRCNIIHLKGLARAAEGAACVGMVVLTAACEMPSSEDQEASLLLDSLPQGLSTAAQKQDLEHRRNAVRRFFDEMLAGLDIQETTRTELGTIVDWLPAGPRLHSPPPNPDPLELLEGEELARSELEFQPWARGPEGTLPHARFDVERYLEVVGENVPNDPEDVLDAVPPPQS